MAKVKCFFRFIDEEQKQKFKESCCLFTISVGQQSHEGEYFDATIELINNSFDSCIMLVDDSLQRYTMAMNSKKDPDFFYELSIKEGDLWLERNKQYYRKLSNLKKIVRWDTWLNHDAFKKKKRIIEEKISSDDNYRQSFEISVNNFIEKYNKRIDGKGNIDYNRMRTLSFDFIKEECTAFCLWEELNCEYEVYPGIHNLAIIKTRELFVSSNKPRLLNAITLGFRNAKQLLPQCFVLGEDT